MKYVYMLLFVLMLIVSSGFCQEDDATPKEFPTLSGPYLGQTPPGMVPELFAPGIINVEGMEHCVPSFSPDGRAVYWTTSDMSGERPKAVIWFMEEKNSVWTPPAVALFSGEYTDVSPFFSHDGNRIYFSSRRPGGTGEGGNLWYVERTDTGRKEPVCMGAPPNSEFGVSQATFMNDGTVYFKGKFEGGQWNIGIYYSQFKDGSYHAPEAMGPMFNTEQADCYPFIASDGSYLLFGSSRPGAKSTETDLYVSFRDDQNQWSEPVRMGDEINNGLTVSFSFVTHDGKYLFFNRFDEDATDKFYWVDASIIENYRP